MVKLLCVAHSKLGLKLQDQIKTDSLHKMNFSAHNYTNIDILSRMELVRNSAIWGALIVHRKKSKEYKI